MPLLQFGHVKGSVPDGTAQDWDMLVAQQSSGPPPPVLADANDGAFVLTASDAAGMPRALLLTHRNLLLFDDPSEVQMVTGYAFCPDVWIKRIRKTSIIEWCPKHQKSVS